jgi:peroxiredoxin
MLPALAALVAIGHSIPPVTLPGVDGKTVKLDWKDAAATVIVFISADCPISLEYGDRLSALHARFEAQGIRFVAVAPNANESDEAVRRMKESGELGFPIYRDPGGRLSASAGARTTPAAVVVDRAGRLRYRGQIDDARNPARVKKDTLRMAVDDLLAGRGIAEPETGSPGCAIKRAGP